MVRVSIGVKNKPTGPFDIDRVLKFRNIGGLFIDDVNLYFCFPSVGQLKRGQVYEQKFWQKLNAANAADLA